MLGLGTCEEEVDDETLENIVKNIESGTRFINFFFLGDLISAAFDNVMSRGEDLSNELRYGKIKLALGSFNFPNPDLSAQEDIYLHIADIPIAVELYNDFMREKVVSRNVDSYPLLIFIRDIIRNLAFEALGSYCYGETFKPSLILDTAQINVDSLEGNIDPISSAIEEQKPESNRLDMDQYKININDKGNQKFLFNSFNNKSMAEKYNYFVVYAFNKIPGALEFEPNDSEYDTRYERDFSRGIYHLTAGLDRGLVKKMTFNKTTQTFLREARFMESDFDPELQLSNVYNATVELFGNNLFFPGSQVYINPRGLGADLLGDPSVKGSNANLMGLGGYHVVSKVNNKISRDGFSTTIEALFTTSGDGLSSTFDDKSVVGKEVLEECASLQEAIDALSTSFSQEGIGA
jgi:hypothetical protein